MSDTPEKPADIPAVGSFLTNTVPQTGYVGHENWRTAPHQDTEHTIEPGHRWVVVDHRFLNGEWNCDLISIPVTIDGLDGYVMSITPSVAAVLAEFAPTE